MGLLGTSFWGGGDSLAQASVCGRSALDFVYPAFVLCLLVSGASFLVLYHRLCEERSELMMV